MRLRGTVLGLSLFVCACEGAGTGEGVDDVSRSIINGTDDRVEISQTSPTVQTIAKAVLGIFPASGVVQNADGTYHINDFPTQPSLCANERFASEHSKAGCTGFLIAPDLALTAGHCVFQFNSWKITAPFANGQSAKASSGTTYDWNNTTESVDPNEHDIGLIANVADDLLR